MPLRDPIHTCALSVKGCYDCDCFNRRQHHWTARPQKHGYSRWNSISSCPMYRDSVTSGLGGRHIYFQYNATSGEIVDNTIEQLDLKNAGIAVGILLPCALELEIWCKPQMTTNGLHTWFLEHGVRPISIAYCSPNVSDKSHESAWLDLWRFQSYGDESGPVGNSLPMSNTRVNMQDSHWSWMVFRFGDNSLTDSPLVISSSSVYA